VGRTLIYIFVSIIFLIFLFSACSEENSEPEKGVIEEFTERTGREASESIKSPLDKARALQEKSAENVSRSDSLLNE
jgi:hypothetical protein